MSQLTSLLYEIVDSWSREQQEQMINILQENNKIATGYLISSIIYSVVIKGDNVEVEFANAEYGKYVDEGRLPGKFPPLDAIKEWCQVKGIPESAAFPIAKSIAENGIPPVQFLDVPFNNADKLVELISEQLTKEMTIELQRVVDTNFKK
jgi:hypothetical protein